MNTLKNILEKELDEKDVVRKFGKTELSNVKTKPILVYILDLVLAVGYRVKSKRGILFRIWVNKRLKEYLIKGYVIDRDRTTVTTENFNNLVVVVNNIYSNQITTNKKIIKISNGG